MEINLNCFKCGKQLVFSNSIPFKEACDKCNYDVHCCKNCKFFDPAAYNSCKETQADRVVEKEKANFCDYFRAGDNNLKNLADSQEKSSRNKLESLFK